MQNAIEAEAIVSEAEAIVSRVLTEEILGLSQAREVIKELTGSRPDKSSIVRWIRKGLGGVKLEAVRLGGRDLFTSKQAITRFIQARTASL